jgi:hypothetical protein
LLLHLAAVEHRDCANGLFFILNFLSYLIVNDTTPDDTLDKVSSLFSISSDAESYLWKVLSLGKITFQFNLILLICNLLLG